MDKKIYKIHRTELIPYARSVSHLSTFQSNANSKYLSMIDLVLRTEAFYFSYTYDITHTFQRLQNSPPDFHSNSFIERADQRFLWNRSLLEPFLNDPSLAQYALPIIHGFVAMHKVEIDEHSFLYAVISRRSTRRAGTRLFIRGIDDEGNVANFVETEQIIQLPHVACSYIQTRGSVPCYWSQLPNISYKPRVAVLPTNNHLNAFRQHFEEQEFYYGRQFLISLTNQHGAEGKLNAKYRQLYEASENPSLKFEDFDFHKECAGMRYDRLTILLARVIADQDDYSYFAVKRDGTLKSIQTGVFRTNCIDCLDRTNVVQTLLAKRMLEKQLRHYHIIKPNENIDSYARLSHLFKNIWADNADFVSLEYAGTGALKTDYTRTGQRSTRGLLQDGYNSALRYILNNFYDGHRQDAIDVFLGNYRITSEEIRVPELSPINRGLNRKYLLIPLTFFITCSMCLINLLIVSRPHREHWFHVFAWGLASIFSLSMTMVWGKELVNIPRLHVKIKRD